MKNNIEYERLLVTHRCCIRELISMIYKIDMEDPDAFTYLLEDDDRPKSCELRSMLLYLIEATNTKDCSVMDEIIAIRDRDFPK